MNKDSRIALCPNLERLLHSDLLPKLVAILNAVPDLKPLFPELLQLRLVVDANRIRAELYWRLKKRKNSSSRSALHESIDAGVLVLIAPEHAVHEIEEHFLDIAEQTGRTEAEVKQEWAQFQKCLRFYGPRALPSAGESYADIDDFPYLAAWRELDARAIYTQDPHLEAMGAAVVSVLIDTNLRDYARGSTVQVAVGIGSTVSFVLGWEFLRVVYELLVRCVQAVRRLPPAAQMALVAAGVFCVAHPKSRAKLKDGWSNLKSSEAFVAFSDAVADFATQVAESAEKAERNLRTVQQVLPNPKRRTLIMHARAVFALGSTPLTLAELERQIRLGGYVSRSRNFHKYLRSVLLKDGRFVEVKPGYWAIRGEIEIGAASGGL